MKNLYALNQENHLIHIKNVDKTLKEKYTCCNCNGELIPRKGKIKAHHFSHKAEGNCSYESYLHKVSKIKFFEEYSDCLKNKKPFLIEYKVYQTCISCKNIERINLSCDLGFRKQKLDLTKWFDEIAIERSHKGFIADIYLNSSKTGETIFIEFAVTHQCENEKINSGIRIIEIDLINENDLNFIDKRFIPATKENIKFYNFKVKEEKKTYYDSKICNRSFEVFSVFKNNQSAKKKLPMKWIFQDLQNFDIKHYQILPFQEESYGGEKFINLVKEYAFKDPKYKNCYSCRFITKNNSYFAEYNLFCKRLRSEIPNSNMGGDCQKYWRIEKLNNL